MLSLQTNMDIQSISYFAQKESKNNKFRGYLFINRSFFFLYSEVNEIIYNYNGKIKFGNSMFEYDLIETEASLFDQNLISQIICLSNIFYRSSLV